MAFGYHSRGANRFHGQGYQDLGNPRRPSDFHDGHFEDDGLGADFSDEIGDYMRNILLHMSCLLRALQKRIHLLRLSDERDIPHIPIIRSLHPTRTTT